MKKFDAVDLIFNTAAVLVVVDLLLLAFWLAKELRCTH